MTSREITKYVARVRIEIAFLPTTIVNLMIIKIILWLLIVRLSSVIP